MHILCGSSVYCVYVRTCVYRSEEEEGGKTTYRMQWLLDESVYICHVRVCSVCSWFRQMTWSPRSSCYSASFIPYSSSRRPPVYFPFLCIFHLSACSNDGIPVWKLHAHIFFKMWLLVLLHKLTTSVTSVFVCACMWIMGSCEHEQHSQHAEMGERKCSRVKAPLLWIQRGGGTQKSTAKWCRSFLYLQDEGPWIRTLTHKYRHLGSQWQVLCGG